MLLQDMMERGVKQRIKYIANSRICQSIYFVKAAIPAKEWEAFTLTNLVAQPS